MVDPALTRSPELSETSRLADRRIVVTGDRAWVLGTADGRYPAAGFHTRGEMGGFWLPNLKLLDGMWFGIDDGWIGAGTKTTTGWGYVRTDLPDTDGVSASRTDFVPDGVSGALVGLSLRSATHQDDHPAGRRPLRAAGLLPVGRDQPEPADREPARTRCRQQGRHLVFRDRGTPPHANSEAHDWAAAFGSTLRADRRRPDRPGLPRTAGPGGHLPGVRPRRAGAAAALRRHRVRQGRRRSAELPDHAAGRRGADGLVRRRRLDRRPGRGPGRAAGGPAATRPARWRTSCGARKRIDRQTTVDLPGDPLLAASVRWSKQMLAASEQRVDDVPLRGWTPARTIRRRSARLDSMRWFGAGWPDYTWLFGTDGEYTAYAAVAAGQFDPIKAHLRALRDVSEIVNGGSGKIVHEVTPDGAVYFGANADAGNTDESSKYPSAVNLVWKWTGDRAFLRDLYPASVEAMQLRRRAGRRRRRLARGAGQRRAARDGRGEAGQRRLHHPRLRRPGRPGPGPRRPSRPGAGRSAGAAAARRSSSGLVVRRRHPLLRRLAGRPGQRQGVPAALDRADPDRRRAAAHPGSRRRSAGHARARATHARPSTSGPATPASSASSTPAPARPRRRPATPAPAATRWSRRCPASGTSSP